MEHLLLFFGLISGLLLINLKRLNKARGKHKTTFSFKKFTKDNMISTLIVFIVGVIVIIDPTGVDVLKKILPATLDFKMSTFYMMLFGLSGDVFVTALLEMLTHKKQTYIGINKK